jgi:hypothetical protein
MTEEGNTEITMPKHHARLTQIADAQLVRENERLKAELDAVEGHSATLYPKELIEKADRYRKALEEIRDSKPWLAHLLDWAKHIIGVANKALQEDKNASPSTRS